MILNPFQRIEIQLVVLSGKKTAEIERNTKLRIVVHWKPLLGSISYRMFAFAVRRTRPLNEQCHKTLS